MIKNRARLIEAASLEPQWDVIVIGGGATGFGTAVEAASRGLKTLLLEKYDFGKGTSSRSTKLIHGGVRYLRQGDISLVRTALRERQLLLNNAPAVTRVQPFIIPVYSRWEKLFYGVGMKVYDLLAGRKNIGRSSVLSQSETRSRLPMLNVRPATNGKPAGILKGGVLYFDGQFDDSRLIIALMETLFRFDGVALNYCEVTGLIKEGAREDHGGIGNGIDKGLGSGDGIDKELGNALSGEAASGMVSGVMMKDTETGTEHLLNAKVVINATGIFADDIRRMDDQTSGSMIRTSQGIHLVLDRSFHPGEDAIMIPKTGDGRVLFAVPWHDKVILGTTDTQTGSREPEPQALEEEIEYLLTYAGMYLKKAPRRTDVKSIYAGLRPLIASSRQQKTSALSRDHTLFRDPSGLITITGGKWTTYRHMGEETIDLVLRTTDLKAGRSVTSKTPLGGMMMPGHEGEGTQPQLLHPDLRLSVSDVKYACRYEMARTVEDVLARRTRCLFLDARAASDVAHEVASLMAKELGYEETKSLGKRGWVDDQTGSFRALTETYTLR